MNSFNPLPSFHQGSAAIDCVDPSTGVSDWHTDWELGDCEYTDESGFFPWSAEHALSKSEFRNDLLRIHILYQRHGYFDARLVEYAVRPDGEGEATVSMTVEEGEPTRVDSLSIEGLEDVADAPSAEDLIGNVPLQVGTTNGGTDGSAFVPYGAPNVAISWPARYSHSPGEI